MDGELVFNPSSSVLSSHGTLFMCFGSIELFFSTPLAIVGSLWHNTWYSLSEGLTSPISLTEGAMWGAGVKRTSCSILDVLTSELSIAKDMLYNQQVNIMAGMTSDGLDI